MAFIPTDSWSQFAILKRNIVIENALEIARKELKKLLVDTRCNLEDIVITSNCLNFGILTNSKKI